MVKDTTADYSDDEMHAALDVNMPNYASAIVTTTKIVGSIFSLSKRKVSTEVQVRGQKQGAHIMDTKLEVLVVPVSDVDRAKTFYEKLGFRLDIDYVAAEDFRVIQFTPPSSEASIIFGKGITSALPGSVDHLVLAVYDIDAARGDLIARGVDVSEVFHYAGGPFNNAVKNPRVGGRDPQGRSYHSFASFEDPDGNGWLLQEIKERLPGRV